jgi:ABC-type uncharacterized transport system substrate-binding protein
MRAPPHLNRDGYTLGGNLTGINSFNVELMPKRLELLSELVPQARVLALLADPNSRITEPMIRDVQEVARAKGVQLRRGMRTCAHARERLDLTFSLSDCWRYTGRCCI